MLLGLGVVKSAVEIFQKLHSWEDLAVCYQTLGWYAKVRDMETLVRRKIKIDIAAAFSSAPPLIHYRVLPQNSVRNIEDESSMLLFL